VIRQAALYFPTDADGRGALQTVAGRPVAFRAILAAIRAGATRIGVPAALRATPLGRAVAASPAARAAVVWLTDGAPLADEPTLLIPASAVAPSPALARLLGSSPPAVLAPSLGQGAPIVAAGPELLRRLADALARGLPIGDPLDQAPGRRDATPVAGDAWCVRVRDPHDADAAEARLYAGLGSPIDTPLDVRLHRRLSRLVSRWAVARSITPNQMSLAGLAVGLVAAWCVWRGTAAAAAAGFVLYVVAVVLDHADGEIARLTLAESALGEWLDVLIDSVLHALLVAAMGAAAERRAGAGLVLGLLGAAGVAASAIFAKLSPLTWTADLSADRTGRLLRALGSRDGFYATFAAFVAALAGPPAALPLLMGIVAVGSHAYWVARLLHRLVRAV
jgi:phosphatidylglycerophosphate synthase